MSKITANDGILNRKTIAVLVFVGIVTGPGLEKVVRLDISRWFRVQGFVFFVFRHPNLYMLK